MGCLFGLAVVHFTTFSMALRNGGGRVTRTDAFWEAVFYDFLVGIPAAALCGWGIAWYLRFRSESAAAEAEDS